MGTAISCTKCRQVAWSYPKGQQGLFEGFFSLCGSLTHSLTHIHTHKVYDTEVYANYRNRKVGQQIDHRFSMNLNRTIVS